MEFSDENTQFYKLLYNHRKIYTHSHSVCLGCRGDSFDVSSYIPGGPKKSTPL